MIVRRRTDGHVWAMADLCPHAGYPLHEGDIEDVPEALGGRQLGAPVVSCPAHAYLFDMQRGTCLSERRCPASPVYDVLIESGQVLLARAPRGGPDVGAQVLSVQEANQLQLHLVDVALTRKYGPAQPATR